MSGLRILLVSEDIPNPKLGGLGKHAVALGNERERRAVLIRALPTPPPLGIMGNLNEDEARQYRTHLFEAHIAFVPAQAAIYETLARHELVGAYLYYRPTRPEQKRKEPVFYDRPEALTECSRQPSLWAYFLEDEPDGRYHETDLPALAIPRDVERANLFCRVRDPAHPTYLQIDTGDYPRNLYLYGQIPDYLCTHAYAVGTEKVIAATGERVRHTQAASRPRPFYYLNCGYCRRDGAREYSPEEMRLEVGTALAGGAKSLQWYPAHGPAGLLAHPRMWNAVGEMNGILHQVLPLVSLGVPCDTPAVDKGDLLGSTICCGDRALVVVLVNRDFAANAERFSLTPVREVGVSVRLPAWFKATGVSQLRFPEVTQALPARIEAGVATFRLDVTAVAVAVIHADSTVPDQMRTAHQRCAAQFAPLAEKSGR